MNIEYPLFVKFQIEDPDYTPERIEKLKKFKTTISPYINYIYLFDISVDTLDDSFNPLYRSQSPASSIDNRIFNNATFLIFAKNPSREMENIEKIENFVFKFFQKKFGLKNYSSNYLDSLFLELFNIFRPNESRILNSNDAHRYIFGEKMHSIYKRTTLQYCKELFDDLGSQNFINLRLFKYNDILEDLKNSLNFNDDIRIISAGESEQAEFKSSLRFCMKERRKNTELEYDVLKSICAMANKRGGKVYIGVNDDGEILGLENDYNTFSTGKNSDKFLLYLTDIIEHRIKPHIAHYIKKDILEIEGKQICSINVEESLKPIYLVQKGERHFVVREGTKSPKYSQEKIDEHIRVKKHTNSDYLVD